MGYIKCNVRMYIKICNKSSIYFQFRYQNIDINLLLNEMNKIIIYYHSDL